MNLEVPIHHTLINTSSFLFSHKQDLWDSRPIKWAQPHHLLTHHWATSRILSKAKRHLSVQINRSIILKTFKIAAAKPLVKTIHSNSSSMAILDRTLRINRISRAIIQ